MSMYPLGKSNDKGTFSCETICIDAIQRNRAYVYLYSIQSFSFKAKLVN